MKKSLNIIFIGATAFALSGCVHHLTQAECQITNWPQLGQQDGSLGKHVRNLAQFTQDCQKFKLKVDVQGYMRGWHKGVKVYCTPSYNTGFADGSSGKSLNFIMGRENFCLSAQAKLSLQKYKPGYNKGLQKFCTYNTGYDWGLQGKQPPVDVCPANLRAKVLSGWKAAARKYCSKSANGFSLGKTGKSYPQMCPAAYYPNFKSQYDRGRAVHNRITYLKNEITSIKDEISDLAMRYGFYQNYDGHYEIGTDHSWHAWHALHEVWRLQSEIRRIKSEIFRAKTKA